MLTRRLIRILFILPVVLSATAWALSVQHPLQISHFQDGNLTTCGLNAGIFYLHRDETACIAVSSWRFAIDSPPP